MDKPAGAARKRAKRLRFRSILPWWQPYVFIFPFFFLYLTMKLYPTIDSFFTSFTQWNGLNEKAFVGLGNYANLLTDTRFYQSLLNTARFTLIPLPFQVIGGLLLAVLMTSPFVHCKRIYQVFTFLPYLISAVAAGLLFALLFDLRVGTVNRMLLALGVIKEELNWLGDAALAPTVVIIMLIWKHLGYYMVLMIAGITNISSDLYDAAMVDGANQAQIFFKITLPQMRNVLLFVVIQGVIGSLQLVEEPMTLIAGTFSGGGQSVPAGGPGRSSLTMMWYMYDTGFGTNMNYGYACAISFAVLLLICICSFLIYRITNKRGED